MALSLPTNTKLETLSKNEDVESQCQTTSNLDETAQARIFRIASLTPLGKWSDN
jgi:hypothetical protein